MWIWELLRFWNWSGILSFILHFGIWISILDLWGIFRFIWYLIALLAFHKAFWDLSGILGFIRIWDLLVILELMRKFGIQDGMLGSILNFAIHRDFGFYQGICIFTWDFIWDLFRILESISDFGIYLAFWNLFWWITIWSHKG